MTPSMTPSMTPRQINNAAFTAALAGALAALPVALPIALPTQPALAQTTITTAEDEARAIARKRDTMNRLMKRVNVEIREDSLENVVEFIEAVAGVELEPRWFDERNGLGLDRDEPITLSVKGGTLLSILERIRERVETRGLGGAQSWQFTTYGAFEFGPKELLNIRKTAEIYDIRDLLFVIPRFDDAPDFDLDSIFQSANQGGGGGGGQSPFGDTDVETDAPTYEERVEELIDLITQFVEEDEWQINGGEGGRIREWRGNLIITAPDYIHRQVSGYAWWPANRQRTQIIAGTPRVEFTPTRRRAARDFDPIGPGPLVQTAPEADDRPDGVTAEAPAETKPAPQTKPAPEPAPAAPES